MSTEEEAAAKAAADAASKPVTMAELTALLNEHNTKTNAAFAEHGKRLKKDFEKQLAALTAKPKPADGDGNDVDEQAGEQPNKPPKPAVTPEKKPEPQAAPQPDPLVSKLQKELEAMKAKQRDAEQKAAQAERRRMEAEGHQAIKTALSGKVAAGSEDVVLATLKGRGAVIIGDDGAVRLKLGTKDEPEEGLELTEAIPQYLKTNEAKFFLPVPNAGLTVKKPTGQTPPAARQNGSATNVEEAFQQKTGRSITDVL